MLMLPSRRSKRDQPRELVNQHTHLKIVFFYCIYEWLLWSKYLTCGMLTIFLRVLKGSDDNCTRYKYKIHVAPTHTVLISGMDFSRRRMQPGCSYLMNRSRSCDNFLILSHIHQQTQTQHRPTHSQIHRR